VRSVRIRRVGVVVATALVALVLSAANALAQSYPGGGQTPPTNVGGEKFFRGARGTARTGSNVLTLVLLALLILALGAVLYYVGRRKAGSEA
jgi:LPXTG-motif cell wall-anchored protein